MKTAEPKTFNMSKTKHCTDCGCELDEGEGQVFTCCEKCWDKKYPKETKMGWKDELEEICGEEYIEAVEALIESLLKKQRESCALAIPVKSDEYCLSNYDRSLIKNAPEPGDSDGIAKTETDTGHLIDMPDLEGGSE